MIPWFERPVIYDVRARPHLVESTSGSRDLQMVNFSDYLFPPLPKDLKRKKKEIKTGEKMGTFVTIAK